MGMTWDEAVVREMLPPEDEPVAGNETPGTALVDGKRLAFPEDRHHPGTQGGPTQIATAKTVEPPFNVLQVARGRQVRIGREQLADTHGLGVGSSRLEGVDHQQGHHDGPRPVRDPYSQETARHRQPD